MANVAVLTKGKSFGTHYQKQRLASASAIGAGVTAAADVDVSDFDNISVLVSMTAAVIGDLIVTVYGFDVGGNVHLIPLSPSPAPQAQVISAGAALAAVQYDLRGIDTVRIAVKNNNAGAQTINFIDFYAAVAGIDF